jgi:outer membrane autotransporter protein
MKRTRWIQRGRRVPTFIAIALLCFAPQIASADYLSDAATAWNTVGTNFGNSAAVATMLSTLPRSVNPAYADDIAILAFNSSSAVLYNARRHADESLGALSQPLDSRGQDLGLNGRAFWDTSRYESNENSGFDETGWGVSVSGEALVNETTSVGIGITTGRADYTRTGVDEYAANNSISLFARFKPGRAFFNFGAMLGRADWTDTRTIGGVDDETSFSTDMLALRAIAGAALGRGGFSITPHIGAEYLSAGTDGHTDSATQSFRSWNQQMITGLAGLCFGGEVDTGGALLKPRFSLGISQIFQNSGSNSIGASLINGATYAIPVDKLAGTAFNGGLGLALAGENFSLEIEYKLNAQENYFAHIVGLNGTVRF